MLRSTVTCDSDASFLSDASTEVQLPFFSRPCHQPPMATLFSGRVIPVSSKDFSRSPGSGQADRGPDHRIRDCRLPIARTARPASVLHPSDQVQLSTAPRPYPALITAWSPLVRWPVPGYHVTTPKAMESLLWGGVTIPLETSALTYSTRRPPDDAQADDGRISLEG
jgi:hypothetical protein